MQQEMTKEILKSYRSNMEEIRELQYKLAHLGEGDTMTGNSTILNGLYYPPKPESVVGVDWGKMGRLEARYKKQIAELQAECAEVELWIEEIPDSLTRRIFRMVFIDGMTQKQVGKVIHLDRSRVSRKIDDFLKTHTKHKKHMYNES